MKVTLLAAISGFASAMFEEDNRPELQYMRYYNGDTSGARSPMTLHVMSDKGLKGMGAVCLDGSDATFYFAPAADPKNANDWQIHFQGGGWCYDEMDCWGRSSIPDLGTSKGLQPTMTEGGIMGDDCSKNPDFCNFNRVHMVYCDGNSFSGNRDEPLVVTGLDGKPKPLYFRGKRIIDATLQTLMTMGLNKAENVLLDGCSAGGLATFLHADYVHDWLQQAGVPMKKFRSAPISGFFLLHNNVDNKPVYPEEMQSIFNMANTTHGLNERCIAAHRDAEKWKCNFAEVSYAYIQAPVFPFNSALDSWQTLCIYTALLPKGFPNQNDTSNGICKSPDWYDCAVDPEKCSSDQMTIMNQYMTDFNIAMQNKSTYRKAGNGAFVSSCHTHCEAISDGWNTIKVNGMSIQEAFSQWWHSEREAASKHSYSDCIYHTTSPHQCNPSCGAADEQHLVVV